MEDEFVLRRPLATAWEKPRRAQPAAMDDGTAGCRRHASARHMPLALMLLLPPPLPQRRMMRIQQRWSVAEEELCRCGSCVVDDATAALIVFLRSPCSKLMHGESTTKSISIYICLIKLGTRQNGAQHALIHQDH